MQPAQSTFDNPADEAQAASMFRVAFGPHGLNSALAKFVAMWLRIVAALSFTRFGRRRGRPRLPCTGPGQGDRQRPVSSASNWPAMAWPAELRARCAIKSLRQHHVQCVGASRMEIDGHGLAAWCAEDDRKALICVWNRSIVDWDVVSAVCERPICHAFVYGESLNINVCYRTALQINCLAGNHSAGRFACRQNGKHDCEKRPIHCLPPLKCHTCSVHR